VYVAKYTAARMACRIRPLTQVSAIVPLLKVATGAHIVFYGHYPDLLLTRRSSGVRRAYRAPFDALERATTRAADRILVNSAFTQRVYGALFGAAVAARADVLHPCVELPPDAALDAERSAWQDGVQLLQRSSRTGSMRCCMCSVWHTVLRCAQHNDLLRVLHHDPVPA
jgi:hypothetical protein